MDLETTRKFLGWCILFNWALVLVWWGFVALAGDWVYALHTRWFDLSRQRFDAIHYAAMVFFKITVVVVNLVPYLVLRLMF